MDDLLKKFSLRKIIYKEWTELFCNKIWFFSLISTTIIFSLMYLPVRQDETLVKEIIDNVINIDITLMGISISYIIFVITLVFTAWSKTKLLKLQQQSIELFTQVFSPYLIIVSFICFQLIASLVIKYSVLLQTEHKMSFSLNQNIIDFTSHDIAIFVIFWLLLHGIIFLLHTLTLFIKDMTMYSKMELEEEATADELLVEYYNNSEQIIQKLNEENENLKEQLSILKEEKRTSLDDFDEESEDIIKKDVENENHTD